MTTPTESKPRTLEFGFACPSPDINTLRKVLSPYKHWEMVSPPAEAQAQGFVWGLRVPIPKEALARWHVSRICRLIVLPPQTRFGWMDTQEAN